MTTTALRAAPPQGVPGPEDRTWDPVTQYVLTGLCTTAGQGLRTWVVARVTGDAWAVIAGSDGVDPATADPVPWRETVCSVVQRSGDAVLVGDLRRRRDPVLRGSFDRWGLRGYVGAPLAGPDGTRVGSLCGWSTTPVHDDEQLRERVTQQARFLGRQLSRELQRVEADRHRDWKAVDAAREGRDALTRVADRRTWEALLEREDDRSRWLADPVEVTVVDAAAVGSTRAMRRVARALVDAVDGDGAVARIGARRFGVLSAGGPDGGTAPADRLVGRLAATTPLVRTGRAARRGTATAAAVWAAAEADLVTGQRR